MKSNNFTTREKKYFKIVLDILKIRAIITNEKEKYVAEK